MANTKPPVQFSIIRIKTEQFALLNEAYIEAKKDLVSLESNVSFGSSVNEAIIMVSPKFTFKQDGVPFLTIQVSSFFRIETESWEKIYNPQAEQIILSSGFAAHLAAVSIGVVRGVLHAKTEQTDFNSFIIPLVNVKQGIDEDLTLDTKSPLTELETKKKRQPKSNKS